MKVAIAEELIGLTPAEKHELGEALTASADSEATPLTDAQRVAPRARLARHRAHPGEAVVSFQEIKARLLATAV